LDSPSKRLASARLLVLAALTLCFVAQFFFTGEFFTRRNDTNPEPMEPRHVAGLVLLGLAVGLAVWADRREGGAPPPREPGREDPAFWHRVRIPALLAICSSTGSLVAMLVAGETALVRAAWVAGMILFFVPLARGARRGAGPPRLWWPDVAAVTALTGLGFWLRYVRLTELPNSIHPDVALMGRVTLELMQRGDARWFGLAASDHPLSTHQILAFGMRLFGTNHYGLVMLSVLAGTATLPVVFLLGRGLFGRSAALLGTLMLAMNYTHIHFSRTLFGPIATLLVTVGVLLLVRGLVSGAPTSYGFAGGFLAAAMFTYDSGRIGLLVAGAAFALETVRGRVFRRGGLARWAAFLAGSFVVFAPMLGFALREPRAFVGRGNVVTLLDPEVYRHSMAKYDADDAVDVVLEQVRRTALAFHLFGDESPHFAFPRPAVGALTAALLVLGTGFSVRRVRWTPVALLWVWLALTLLLGGVLTSDPPYWPHLNILLPPVAIIAGLGGERIAAVLAGDRAGLRGGVLLLIGGLVFASGIHGWRVYNEFESNNAEPIMRASRYLQGLPQNTKVFLVSKNLHWGDDVFQFFNRRMAGEDQTVDGLLRPGFRIEPPAVILLRTQQKELGRIVERYPGGTVRELRQPDLKTPVFVVYEILAGPRSAPASVR
jgi:4-amino-4-deoxy-L-arabinose transferase-like glycosyltransferase